MSDVTVIGWDGGLLPTPAMEALTSATLVLGRPDDLAAVERLAAAQAQRVVLDDLPTAVGRLAAHDGAAVVVAGGDPGFFGIVRTLRRAGLTPRVIPAVSAVARAFARLGLPWEDALVVAAHRGTLRRVVNACRAHPVVAVLLGPDVRPADLAEALRGLSRRLIAASDLDPAAARAGEREIILVLSDQEQAPRPDRWLAGADPGPAGWALTDAKFVHREPLITRTEVRALVLAKLGPRLGDLVWEVGAGSGTVAVESARLGAAAIAVDRSPDACTDVAANAFGHGVDVQVVQGEAPEALAELPDPDAVFVAGGGPAVFEACLARRPARLVAVTDVVERVGPALSALRAADYVAHGVHLQANRLMPDPEGWHQLEPTAPVYVVWGERP
ncbi:MAG TPA: SAM-dependent methyltransferase [Pilimelia sp.]|nr:SAM-dependent methyltransferase [Pilimelia sp.]